jgi:large subunit ribosomal protein L21
MYAVITSGGKQFRVEEGQTLKLEKLTAEVGETVNFDRVLMIVNGDDIKVGKPFLKTGKVAASVVSHGRHKKIRIIKFRRRKHHMKQMGHRQYFTEVKITQIAGA